VVSDSFLGLEEINIRNLGVIESAVIEFKPGLNVLTGETGAGKTMVLTALSLILGGKSDAEKVRKGAERMVVSGRFCVPGNLLPELNELGLDLEENSLVISRIISSEGKSRISAGGVSVTASRVADLAQSLVEVHAQSSVNRLTKSGFVRETLDSFGNLNQVVIEVSGLFDEHKVIAGRIAGLRNDRLVRERELEKLAEFMRAFNAISPKIGELSEIESDLTRLNSVDELQQAVSSALNFMETEESSTVTALTSAKRALDHVREKDSELDEIAQKLGDHLFGVQEVTGSLLRYLTALDADPSRLEYLQERKSALNALIKKFGEGSDRERALVEIVVRAKESSKRIADLEGGDERIADLEGELRGVFARLLSASNRLSEARGRVAQEMQGKITDELRSLAMIHSSIVVEVLTRAGNSIEDFTTYGLDDIAILFTSHEGATPGALAKVASGGELSRVMLAIEVVLAAVNTVPTYIFDEVDAGVGGKAAVEVGRRLHALAKDAQVIVVTHLAQVAVWADHHLVVRKSEGGMVSISDVISLTSEERSTEIARMLSGQEGSQTAIEHARELLEMVQESVIS
jgi:DNA repair protein RecN (Recombination protein N)